MLVTASPIAGGLEKIYSQARIAGVELETSRTRFIDRYFHTKTVGNYARAIIGPKDGAVEEIFKRLDPITLSVKSRGEGVGESVKSVKESVKKEEFADSVIQVVADASTNLIYSKLKKDLCYKDILAVNRGILAQKLLQICSGFCYDEEGNSTFQFNSKLLALGKLINDHLLHERIIIWNKWVQSEKMILEFLVSTFPQKKVEVLNKEAIDAWNRMEIDILVANPQSAGHGINIYNNCSNMIFFSFDWNAENHMQAKGRLSPARIKLGNSGKENADVYYLITKLSSHESADKLCYDRITGKIKLNQMFKSMFG